MESYGNCKIDTKTIRKRYENYTKNTPTHMLFQNRYEINTKSIRNIYENVQVLQKKWKTLIWCFKNSWRKRWEIIYKNNYIYFCKIGQIMVVRHDHVRAGEVLYARWCLVYADSIHYCFFAFVDIVPHIRFKRMLWVTHCCHDSVCICKG